MPGRLEDPDRQIAQRGHDLRPVCGADLGGVLAVGDVADVVAMAAVTLAVAGRDMPPGQALELRVKAGLVLFTTRM
jgi:hypothetical protein